MGIILFITVGVGGAKQKKIDSLAHGILKSIDGKNPDKIIFFGSVESKKTIESLKKQYEEKNKKKLKDYEFVDITHKINDFDYVFNKMQEKIKENQKDKIIINYTSGTKTMTMSAAICSFLYHKDLILVDGKRDENGIVIKCTENVVEQNLYSAYDKVLFDKVKDLFNLNQFDEAKNILKQITILDKKEEYNDLINAYKLWDLFKHKEAFELLEKLSIEKEKTSKNKGFLGKLNNMSKDKLKEKTKLLLVDIINNAERRINEGKYDDAIARLYRCVELIAQIKLLHYDFNEIDEIERKKFNLEKIKNKGIDTKKYEKYADEKERVKLGLKKKFELLKDLGWSEAEQTYLQNNKLKNLLQKRNNSILAHGFEPIEKQTAIDLFENIKEISEQITMENMEEMLENAKYPNL